MAARRFYFFFLFFFVFAFVVQQQSYAQETAEETTTQQEENEDEIVEDTIPKPLKYPFSDRRGDFFSTPMTNSFVQYSEPPISIINRSLEYSPRMQAFITQEQIGDENVRHPFLLSKKEVNAIASKQADQNYFTKKSNVLLFLSQRGGIPRFSAKNFVFNNIFGVQAIGTDLNRIYDENKQRLKDLKQTGKKTFNVVTRSLKEADSMLKNLPKIDSALVKKKIKQAGNAIADEGKKQWKNTKEEIQKATKEFDSAQLLNIKPKGFVDLIIGAENFTTDNPTLPLSFRSTTSPLLDLKYDGNLNSMIGTKLALPVGFSNLNNFDLKNPLYVVGGVSAATAVASNMAAISSSSPTGSGVNTSIFSTGVSQNLLKQIRIGYKGDPDQIIRQVDVGVTSFQTKSEIIRGPRELFGVKLETQFGRLNLSSVLAYQTSKLKTINLSDGTMSQNIRLKASDYEDNRNFLLGHYFRKQYNQALKKLPFIQSNVRILRVEAWVTNRNAVNADTRQIIAFADLGENGNDIDNRNRIATLINGNAPPDNANNTLYQQLRSDVNLRNPRYAVDVLINKGFVQGRDFERVYAKKIPPNSITIHPTLGYVMLNENVTNESVVGISYEYQIDGKNFKVGEFSEEVILNDAQDYSQLIFTKLLKPITPQPALPLWKLTMRNVYAIGTTGIRKDGFNLYVLYDEPSKGEKIYLPYADAQYKKTIISLLNSDRLNTNNDFLPDGVFDYVEGATVFSEKGRIVFPVLEPFGRDLAYAFSDPSQANKYLFTSLYDSIKSYAQQQIEANRYVLKGSVRNTNSSQIFLGAYNIPQGSVKISQQGHILREGIDFTMDYNIGALTILNKSILDSRLPLVVQLEDNSAIGFQQKTFIGLRAEYLLNKKISIGATYTRLNELPFNFKVLYGQEAVSNQMFGVDVTYKTKSRALTYLLDKALPRFVSKEQSHITAFAEFAKYAPNYNSLSQYVPAGSIYLDDFENSYSNISLSVAPVLNWNLSAVPKGATNDKGSPLFPESNLTNSLDINKNRAHIAWYQIDANFQYAGGLDNPASQTNLLDPRWRRIPTEEIFPSITSNFNNYYSNTFDIAYFPKEKGQYNFATATDELNAQNEFLKPHEKFGAISFAFQDQANFEDKNIEYLQFWMQDPFANQTNSAGGDVYFHLGNVSEDILKDDLRMYENGISTPSFQSEIDTTIWGKVPRNPTPVSTTFIGVANERVLQDVGLDGLSDIEEQKNFLSYLQQLQNNFGASSTIYQKAFNDPASDNFVGIRDAVYPATATILDRYKYFNNTQGNSAISNNATIISAATSTPDKEDLNNDNILNTNESYFQYVLHLKPNMQIGDNYIVDKRTVTANLQLSNQNSPSIQPINWYLFRIPIHSYYAKVGNIADFKSIRFMRMLMHNFKDESVLRLLKFSLVANNWRKANFAIDATGSYLPVNNGNNEKLFVSSINIEENDRRQPIPYAVPPNIFRIQQSLDNNNLVLQNEQSLSLRIKNLQTNEALGVFKNMNLNLINYTDLNMFIHAETLQGEPTVNDKELDAVVRLATDYVNNYYEIKIPLTITKPQSAYTQVDIWPTENNLDIELQLLTQIKNRRNLAGKNPNELYTETINGKTISIMGNPTLADIKGVLVAVHNKTSFSKSAEIWVNELRLNGLNTSNAYAGLARVDMKLADLGTMSLTGNFSTTGFGSIEQKANERARENIKQYTVTSNLDLSKFLPKGLKMNLPFYMNFSQILSTPEYDPLNSDLKLDTKLNALNTQTQKDSLLDVSVDYTKTQTYSFTNVRILPKKGEVLSFYSIKNWDISYTFTGIDKHSPLIQTYDFSTHNGSVNYTFNPLIHYYEPFQNLFLSQSTLAMLIKKININIIPSNLSFRMLFDRYFVITKARSIYEENAFQLPEYYDKRFAITRMYGFKHNLTKSIVIDYKANNFSRIDEPYGRIDNAEKRIDVWTRILNGGRNVLYNHNLLATYTIPTQSIPALNWTTLRVSYNTDYSWQSTPDSLFYLGHSIQNTRKQEADIGLNFNMLFNRFSFAQANSNVQERNLNTFTGAGERSLLKSLIFFLQRGRLNFKETYQTSINGFMLSPQLLGNNLAQLAPGLDFTFFGMQPASAGIEGFAKKEWITHSTELNQNFLQTYTKTITAELELKPFPYLDISLNVNYSYGKNYSELFKDITGNGNFAHLSPYSTGKFEMSYWAFQTAFDNYTNNQTSQAFQNFLLLRKDLSTRLGKTNEQSVLENDGYYKGYNSYAQDVLIPSFIAAYTKANVNGIPLINNQHNRIEDNPFSGFFPLPNWKISYTGLSNVSFLKSLFTLIKLTNGYTGALSSNDISINPRYGELLIGIPMFIDPLSGNFIPYYRIPNITIIEKFEPLIGIDITMKNKITIGFKYSKDRTVSMSIVDFQISENAKEQFATSFSTRIKGSSSMNEIKKIKLRNEFVFKIDVLYAQDFNYNIKFNQDYKTPTGGNTLLNVLPSIEYLAHTNLTFKLFYEYRAAKNNLTQISTINQRGGLLIRLNF